jgi:hypothetical protein
MREIITIKTEDILEDIAQVLFRKKGSSAAVSGRLTQTLEMAYELFDRIAEPAALLSDVTYEEFRSIYFGEGHNERQTPLSTIMREDASYALFAITLGAFISRAISESFKAGNTLLGLLLDELCSAGITAFVDYVADHYRLGKIASERLTPDSVVMHYSPGYCGWHITAQMALHKILGSAEIGITLNRNCYMSPLKSISGVMIGGALSMHRFNNNFHFCENCKTKTCRERLKTQESK